MDPTITTESFSSGGTDFDLYIATPKDPKEKLPAIMVSHAWDGLNEPIKDITRRVAKLGYVAAAVDVYGKGVRGNVDGDNSHLMNPLMEDRVLLRDRLIAGYTAIRELDSIDNTRMGAIGYCFGGLCVLDLARVGADDLKGVVSFHGGLAGSKDLPAAELIKASILLEHGWDDPVAPPEHYLAFTKEMDARKADWQAHIHGGVVHAFTHEGANAPENGILYHEAAARRSWQSMINFFEEVL